MEQTTKGSGAARMAVYYITVGILLVVWSVIWYAYMKKEDVTGDGIYFLCCGCLLSGIAVTVIGFIMGHVGQAARQADLPPTVSATPAVGQVQPVPGQTPGTVAVPAAIPPAAGQVAAVQPPAVAQPGQPVY
jgi:hypothetical protein